MGDNLYRQVRDRRHLILNYIDVFTCQYELLRQRRQRSRDAQDELGESLSESRGWKSVVARLDGPSASALSIIDDTRLALQHKLHMATTSNLNLR